jgi:hypothetical protein
MARRFGPTRGAGTAIIEQESGGSIVPGALGTTAYTGIMKKGPKKAFRAKTKTEFLFKGGALFQGSLLPDAALSFYRHSNGAGEVWYNRVTDGSEKKSTLSLYNQLNSGALVAQFEAGNGGRWGGKKQKIVDEYASITAITLTLSNAPANLKTDELVGALVKLKAVPGKSFEVQSNTSAGVLTFASDISLLDEVAASSDAANKLIEVDLANGGEALGVLVKPGLLNPNTEFGLEFHLIEGNVSELAKNFPDLSIDPSASNYFVDVINADPNSDFVIKATDLNIGGSLVAGQRPANYANEIVGLTATVITAQIHYLVLSSDENAKMKLSAVSLGSEVIKDELVLTNTVQGARADEILTFNDNPANDETLEIAGVVYTWKTVVADEDTQILIGADAEASIDNLVVFAKAKSVLAFVEKDSATVAHVYARTAGLAGNAFTLVSSDANVVASAAVLSGGLDQTWDMVSEKMPFLGTLAVTSGVAFAAPNDFGYGFTLEDTTLDSTKEWDVNDTITISVEPLENQALVGGRIFPDSGDSRKSFIVDSNTANTITAKAGSDMTTVGSVGGTFRAQYIQELSGGYDGVAEVTDFNYEEAYDVGTSPLKSLRGKNLGLIKLATPGITSSAVQKAGVAFAGSQNWQYRYEIPANITDETSAEEFINDTVGRNDFAVVTWPSYVKVTKEGGGLKLITATGMAHGVEARIARDFDGFHKAGAGTDAILNQALALPDGFENREPLDQEFLNPQGINIILEKDGNLVLWGDRTVGTDPAFKFKHHREYLSHVENVFLENFDFIIFNLNNESTQEILKAAFVQFFTPELAKGALVGKDVQEATLLKIDSENNTDSTRDDGDLFVDMALDIVDTVERLIIRIGKQGVTEGAV